MTLQKGGEGSPHRRPAGLAGGAGRPHLEVALPPLRYGVFWILLE